MTDASLSALLARDALSVFERREVAAALRHPWLWPLDPRLEARAREFGLTRPTAAPPGEVLLLSFSHGAPPRGGLARLTRTPGTFGGELTLGRSALSALQLSFGLVTRDLPQLVRPEALTRREVWSGALLHGGPRNLRTLEGESFGLSFALSAASLLTDVPLSCELAASAVVRPDGTLAPVEGLAAKVRVLRANALGVCRLLVAGAQVEEAREACAGELVVEGYATLGEALEAVLPGLGETTPQAWRTPGVARAVARQLFQLILRPQKPMLGWGGVVRAAESLLEALPADDREHQRLVAFTGEVARRHQGLRAPLPWPDDDALARAQAPVRLTLLAHVVQAATDAGASDLALQLERVRALAPGIRDCEQGGLALWGSIGRGLARLRRYDEAAALLEEVLQAWLDALIPERSTFALCELLRVQAIRRDAAALVRLEAQVEEVLAAPMLEETARAYVQHSLARARAELALTGNRRETGPEAHAAGEALRGAGAGALLASDAGPQLASDAALREANVVLLRLGCEQGAVPEHLALSSLRMAARVLASLGDPEAAQQVRARLVSPRLPVYERLAALDAAHETGADVAAALTDLEALEEQRHHLRHLGPDLPPRERAEHIVREFPY
jgi:hypothetical protein